MAGQKGVFYKNMPVFTYEKHDSFYIITNKTEIFNRKTKYMERCKKIVTHKKRMMRKIKNERKGYAVKKSSKKKGTI